jgi:hypothetical protein
MLVTTRSASARRAEALATERIVACYPALSRRVKKRRIGSGMVD